MLRATVLANERAHRHRRLGFRVMYYEYQNGWAVSLRGNGRFRWCGNRVPRYLLVPCHYRHTAIGIDGLEFV